MELKGKVIGLEANDRAVKITVEVKRSFKPGEPSLADVDHDDEKYKKAYEVFEKKMVAFARKQDALANIGVRPVTITFGVDEQ